MSVKKPIANILSMLFILTLASCGSPGTAMPGSGAVTPTATREAQPATAAPTAEPEPVPTGYTAFLQEKIDSGEWTLEEGLVTMLGLFAGEVQASQAGLGQGVLEAEGTGVLQMAGDYLQAGSDLATKDELTRLMNLLVPSQEALDRYSIPEEQASVSAPRRAAPVKQDEVKCETLWEDGFPDYRTPKVPCYLVEGGNVGLDSYQVYFPSDWRGDSSKDAYKTATVEAIQASLTQYQHHALVKSIYFVFSTQEQAPGVGLDTLVWSAFEHFRPATEACPVIVYPAALTALAPLQFRQRIAHEIFHCFLVRNLEDQLLGPGLDSNWWVEGAAEYFSNLVYPTANLEHLFKDSFSLQSTHLPLTSMGHENFAFFQFMGNKISPEGVIEMLGNMPTTPGLDLQVAALAATPGMDGYFEEFVRSVLDDSLMDSDGSSITFLTSYTGQFTFFSGFTSQDFPSRQPFVLTRYWVTLASEREYALDVETTDIGRGGRSGVRFIDGKPGEWASFPETVGGCDPLHYVLYVVTTAPGSERTEIVSTSTSTEAPCDRCLLGSWEATNDSVIAYMQSTAVGDNAPKVESAAGSMFLRFEATGTGSGGYKMLTLHQRGGNYLEGAEVIVTMDGASSGRYTADGFVMTGLSGLGGTSAVSVSVQIIVNGTSLGTTTTPLRPEDFPVGIGTPTSYTCEGDTLTTWPPVEGVVVEPVVWLRSGP
jgi:hypothetical protein